MTFIGHRHAVDGVPRVAFDDDAVGVAVAAVADQRHGQAAYLEVRRGAGTDDALLGVEVAEADDFFGHDRLVGFVWYLVYFCIFLSNAASISLEPSQFFGVILIKFFARLTNAHPIKHE